MTQAKDPYSYSATYWALVERLAHKRDHEFDMKQERLAVATRNKLNGLRTALRENYENERYSVSERKKFKEAYLNLAQTIISINGTWLILKDRESDEATRALQEQLEATTTEDDFNLEEALGQLTQEQIAGPQKPAYEDAIEKMYGRVESDQEREQRKKSEEDENKSGSE